jgi:tetratricopeptide (TPR) repeat protein/TolB-like protein
MPDDGRAPRQPAERSRKPRESQPQWPCLLPSIAVAIAPLRNLTSHPQQQFLVDDFTDRLVIGLFRSCRGFTFTWVAGERRLTPDLSPPDPSELRYVVSGSVQQGSSQGMLRTNIRISDAVTADYLWVCREEFRPEQLTSIETKITGLISRVLHMLVLHEASRRATVTLDTELGATDLLARANAILREELRADLSAEAQKWFLAAFARDARNVEALVGVACTCQFLVSNPWWGDPRANAAAADVGREAVAIALELEPGNARAKYIQGMLYSAAGQLEAAASAFRQALAMDEALPSAHAFGGYNAALLGRAWETSQAVERATHLNPTHASGGHHLRDSILFFFGGFGQLLLGRRDEAVTLLQKSLEHNPTYGSAQLFLMAALSLTARHEEAALVAQSFRQQYLRSPAYAFEQFWLSRSASPVYRTQVYPLFDSIRGLGAGW